MFSGYGVDEASKHPEICAVQNWKEASLKVCKENASGLEEGRGRHRGRTSMRNVPAVKVVQRFQQLEHDILHFGLA
mgnify:CR=1 FL=1